MARVSIVARCLAIAAVAGIFAAASQAFAGPSSSAPLRGGRVLRMAEESKSEALVKIDEVSITGGASVLGALAGFLVGGPWLALAGFVAAAAVVRKEDNDAATALKGVTNASLESVNFVAGVADKYEVGKKIGDAVDNAKSSSPDLAKAVDTVGDAYKSVDKDINIKDTMGSIVTSSSSLASQAVEKAGEINEKYKLTDQLSEKVGEVVDQAKTSTKKA